MSSILANAGRSKIYCTDGTGRDTYIGFNSGGFQPMKTNAACEKGGNIYTPVLTEQPSANNANRDSKLQ